MEVVGAAAVAVLAMVVGAGRLIDWQARRAVQAMRAPCQETIYPRVTVPAPREGQ